MNVRELLMAMASLVFMVLTQVSGAEGFEANTVDTLHYRNAAGVATLGGGFESPTFDWNHETQGGQTVADRYYSFLRANVTADYGVFDNLLVGVNISYMFNQVESRTDSSGSTEGYEMGGIGAPELHLSYRYFGGLNGRFFASAFLNYFPSLGTEKNAVGGLSTGNNLPGNTNTQLGTNLYWVFGQSEVLAEAYLARVSNSTYEDTTNENNTGFAGAYTRYSFVADYRYHLSNEFFAQVGATLNLAYSYALTYPGNNDYETSNNLTSVLPTLSLGWHPQPGRVLQLTYTYQSNTSTISPTGSSNFNQITNQYNHQYLTLSGVLEI